MIPRLLALPFAALLLLSDAVAAEPGYIDIGALTPANGQEFVEVNLQPALLQMAAKLVEKEEPAAAELIRGLKRVRVNVVGLDETNGADVAARIDQVRAGLARDGWTQVVTVRDGNENVDVHVKMRGEEAIEGVVVTVLSGGKEAVFVNVVGDIRPEQISELGERLNIQPLAQLDLGKKH